MPNNNEEEAKNPETENSNEEEIDESMDGDHESALESVYGPGDDDASCGMYDYDFGGE
jgi:hypothetical protein